MKTSIKFKFLIPTVLLIIIAMGASSYISYSQSKNALQDLIIEQVSTQTDSISIIMESWITERKINIKNWTLTTEFPNAVDTGWVDGFSRKKSSEKLTLFNTDYNAFESINLVDANGMVTASSNPELVDKLKVDSQSFFQNALKGETVTSNILKSAKTGKPVFAIAAPVILNEEIVGVLFAFIDFTVFSDKFITPMKIGQKGFSFVLDHQGLAIVYPDKKQIFKLDFSKQDIWASAKDKKDSIISTKLNGNKSLMAFKRLKAPQIYISSAADSNEVFSPLSAIAQRSFYTLVIFALIAAFIIILIANSVLKPLNEVVMNLKDAAEGDGDLTTRIVIKSKDEIGDLAESFNVFIGKIQSIIKDVAQNSKDLTASAENLTNISLEMNSSSDHTSMVATNVASSSEDMKKNIASVAGVLDETSNNINTVAAAADEMSTTINEISQNTSTASQITQNAVIKASEVTEQMNELGNSASEINNVVSTISDISSQVNLLALNATIEAARAGEAGKGFAVVANEIKDLAKQTADATDDIRSKIEGIQTSTTHTVSGIKNITDTVNETNEIVLTVASAIEEQSSATQEIATNISNVSSGVSEVNSSMSHTSDVATNITSKIDEVKISVGELFDNSDKVNSKASELSALASKLDILVNQFKV